MSDSIALAIKPIVRYPRVAQVGKTYLMTIDLEVEPGAEWNYEEEEYPVYCTVDSELFTTQIVGEPVIVLHRFGGSYGEAKFLVTAVAEARQGNVKVALINAWGVPFKTINLEGVQLLLREVAYTLADIRSSITVVSPLEMIFESPVIVKQDSSFLIENFYEIGVHPREIGVSGVGSAPPSFERFWIERSSYQAQLTDYLATFPVIEVVGMAGSGKSSLAAWAYENLKDDFHKRIWINFSQLKSFDQVARFILQEIGFPNRDRQVTEESLLHELLFRLNDPNMLVKTLLVLDQIEPIVAIPDLRWSEWQWFHRFLAGWNESGRKSRILVTTRTQVLHSEAVILGGLTVEEGVALLQKEGVTGSQLLDLVLLVAGHPFLLKLAASWTREHYEGKVGNQAIAFFSELLKNNKIESDLGLVAIPEAIIINLPINLQNLLYRMSVYRLPINLKMAQAMDETVSIEEIESLEYQGLLFSQDVEYVMHPLVSRLVKSILTKELLQDSHHRAIKFYKNIYRDWDGTIESCKSRLEEFHHYCELALYVQAYEVLDQCFTQFEQAGEWRSLLLLYSRLTHEWKAANDLEFKKFGLTWIRLGSLHRNLGDVRLAISNYLQAQEFFSKINITEEKASLYGNLGNAYYSLGNYQEAIDYLFQALEIQETLDNSRGIANSLFNIGNIYSSLGNYHKAIEILFRSLEIQETLEDQRGIATSLSSIGNVYSSLGNYQEAIKTFSHSLEIQRTIGHNQGTAATLHQITTIYINQGRLEEALALGEQALEIQQQIGDNQGIAATLHQIATIYYNTGKTEEALKLYEDSLRIQRSIGNQQGIAATLHQIATVYCNQGRIENSLKFYTDSLSIQRSIGDRRGTAITLTMIAQVLSINRDIHAAISYLQEAIEIFQEISSPELEKVKALLASIREISLSNRVEKVVNINNLTNVMGNISF